MVLTRRFWLLSFAGAGSLRGDCYEGELEDGFTRMFFFVFCTCVFWEFVWGSQCRNGGGWFSLVCFGSFQSYVLGVCVCVCLCVLAC